MKKETLDKLRRYIDLVAKLSHAMAGDDYVASPLRDMMDRAWQEFVEADLAEERELREWLDRGQE